MSGKTDETFFGEWEFMKKVFDDLPSDHPLRDLYDKLTQIID